MAQYLLCFMFGNKHWAPHDRKYKYHACFNALEFRFLLNEYESGLQNASDAFWRMSAAHPVWNFKHLTPLLLGGDVFFLFGARACCCLRGICCGQPNTVVQSFKVQALLQCAF